MRHYFSSTRYLLFAAALVIGSTLELAAQEPKKESEKCEGQCPTATGMNALPEIQFKVNGKLIEGCILCAQAESKKTNKPISFVVGDKAFSDQEKALRELVSETEKRVKDLAKPCKCEKTDTITVAGKKCSCSVDAAEKSKLITAAMKKVKMQYKVGSETCDCPVKAKDLVEKTGKAKEFVVGAECTECELTARLNLARAKYKAGLEALAKTEQAKK